MGRSCCYLAQSCSTFAKNKYPGKSSWCLLQGWKKTTWGRRDGFGIKVSKRAFKQVKGLPKDTLDSLPCQYYSLIPNCSPDSGCGSYSLQVINAEQSHELYTPEIQNFGSCALKYLFIIFLLTAYFGRKANMSELQDWNSSNLSSFSKLQHNSSSSSRREEPCYSRCSTSKHWNDTCWLSCSFRNDKPILNILFSNALQNFPPCFSVAKMSESLKSVQLLLYQLTSNQEAVVLSMVFLYLCMVFCTTGSIGGICNTQLQSFVFKYR